MDIEKEVEYIKNSINTKINTDVSTLPEKKKNTESGNIYALNQYKFNQNRVDYIRNINKKPDKSVTHEDNEDFFNMLLKNDYKKTWSRLSSFQKKTKLTEFVQVDNSLSNDEKKDKLKLLLENINSKTIKYDINTQIIISV